MALRDKLAERAQPELQPGEQIHEIFLAQTGPSPYWAILSYVVFFTVRRRIVVVTDRAVVVLAAGTFMGTTVKGVVARLDRATTLGPVSGLWARTTIGGERLWVHKRFHADLQRADAARVPVDA